MQSSTPQWFATLCLVFALWASSAIAQDQTENQPSESPSKLEIEGTDTVETDQEAEQKQKEKNADIREAVLENLDLKKATQEYEDTPEDTPQQESEQKIPDVESPDAVKDEDEWYYRFSAVADRMQNIPYLSDRGWLHFGRIELEYGHFFKSDLLEDDSGFNFRSLRSGIIKLFDNGMIVKLDIDLTDGDSNFTDLYVRFSTKLGLFTLGNQKVALSLVNQTSRLARTFMEEPLPSEAFGLSRRLGLGWDFHRKKVGVHLTAFGPDLNTGIGKFGYGLRMYTNPKLTRWSLAHIGVSGVREEMDRDARFRARPETRITDTYLVNTRTVTAVESQSIFGLEAAAAHRNWSIRGEYFYTEWERNNQNNTNFTGYYAQASWVLTGESFQYKEGRFLRIRPDSSKGAWELALRYSAIDLNDQNIFGGAEKNTTLALNWYSPGMQLRIQSNLIYVNTDAIAGNVDPLILQVRAQLNW